jgi:hypothetical protein
MISPKELIDNLRSTDRYIETIFTNGGCWKFYEFLKSVYPEAEPYKVVWSDSELNADQLQYILDSELYNHIITKIGNHFYDITGEVNPKSYYACAPATGKSDIKKFSNWSFCDNHFLSKACPYCGEDICIGTDGKVVDEDLSFVEK